MDEPITEENVSSENSSGPDESMDCSASQEIEPSQVRTSQDKKKVDTGTNPKPKSKFNENQKAKGMDVPQTSSGKPRKAKKSKGDQRAKRSNKNTKKK